MGSFIDNSGVKIGESLLRLAQFTSGMLSYFYLLFCVFDVGLLFHCEGVRTCSFVWRPSVAMYIQCTSCSVVEFTSVVCNH